MPPAGLDSLRQNLSCFTGGAFRGYISTQTTECCVAHILVRVTNQCQEQRDFRTITEAFNDASTRSPPCQAVVRHPGAPGSTVEGGDRRQVS